MFALWVSEIRQAVTRLGVDVIGHDSLAVEPMRPFYTLDCTPAIPEEMLPIVPECLNGRAYTIFGGSSEIQREIIPKVLPGHCDSSRYFGRRGQLFLPSPGEGGSAQIERSERRAGVG